MDLTPIPRRPIGHRLISHLKGPSGLQVALSMASASPDLGLEERHYMQTALEMTFGDLFFISTCLWLIHPEVNHKISKMKQF